MTSLPSKSTLRRLLDLTGLHYTISERSGPFWQSMLHNFLSRPLSFPGWTTAMLFWLDFHQTQSNLRSASEQRPITERLKITLQNILVHHSWLVEWSSHPHPECWIPVNLQATTENSSLSTLLDFIIKNKNKTFFFIFQLSLYLSLLPLLACTYLNNAWDLVLRSFPLSVCLFKINRFTYSPIVSRFG